MESVNAGEKTASDPSWLERFGTGVDDIRLWLRNVIRLGTLMGKGAYLSVERRRSFQRLGRKTFERFNDGGLSAAERDPDLKELVQQIARLTKKLELEERLVRNIRFGERRGRKAHGAGMPTPSSVAPTNTFQDPAGDPANPKEGAE